VRKVVLLLLTSVALSITGTSPIFADDWPMFGHDLQHTRYSPSPAPSTDDVLWSYETGEPVFSSPAVAEDKVFVGSEDGKVYCLNAASGDLIWSYQTGDWVYSSPAVAEDKVFVGSEDGKVYCLNAASGDLIWSHETSDMVGSSPAVAGDRVFVGSYDGKVYCLNAASGDLIWSYVTGGRVDSSPAVAGDRVFVGSYDGKVYCLNAASGDLIWSYVTGDWVYSSPAVAEDKVFVGSDDSKVYCLNVENGQEIWSYATGGRVVSSPAVAEDKVFVGSEDGKVYCLDAASGDLKWSYTTGYPVYSSPAVAEDKVFVGSHDNKVYCLDAASGALIWSYATGGRVESSPAVAGGRVFVGSYDNKLYCFSHPTGSILINNGATYTNSQEVTLNLVSSDAAEMRFKNEGSSWASWEAYAPSKSWTLTSGDGEKRVYVQFRSSGGDTSEPYSDTIILDTTSPGGSISIDGGATYTNSQSVTLSLSAENTAQMHFSNDNSFWSSWEPYATSKSWTLSSGDGEKTVYAEFKDPAGNVSKTYSDTIILHRTPPTVAITSPCAGSCLKGEVAIEGTATDDYFEEYEIDCGEGLNPSSWDEITSCCFPVVEGELCCWNTSSLSDGTYTLKLTAWDLASNFAEVKVALKVDNHPPKTTLTEYPLKKVTGNIPKVVAPFSWIGSDPDNITPVEELVYQYRLEGHSSYQDWSGWSKDSATTFLLPSGGYTFKVRAKDEAGNYPAEDDAETARYSFAVSLPLIIYPNPCYLNQGGIVTFSNLPLESEVRVYIYDLGGSLVRLLEETDAVIEGGSKVATWDLKNDNGELVTRDIYIYYIPSATEKRTGKIAIIN